MEAFLSVTFTTVLLCSQITEGLGLSNTLGAFFGGMLLAETSYSHQIEQAIAPFRGLLLGLFFVTVGFAIDLRLLCGSLTTVILRRRCTRPCPRPKGSSRIFFGSWISTAAS